MIIVIISKVGGGKFDGEYDADKLNMPQWNCILLGVRQTEKM